MPSDQLLRLGGVVDLLQLRQPEVGDPDVAEGVQQQVRRLDVAMEDAAAVGVVQRVGDLGADPAATSRGNVLPLGPPPRRPRSLSPNRGRSSPLASSSASVSAPARIAGSGTTDRSPGRRCPSWPAHRRTTRSSPRSSRGRSRTGRSGGPPRPTSNCRRGSPSVPRRKCPFQAARLHFGRAAPGFAAIRGGAVAGRRARGRAAGPR